MFGKVLNRALISFLTIVNTIKGLLKMPKIFPVQPNVADIFLIFQRERERERERDENATSWVVKCFPQLINLSLKMIYVAKLYTLAQDLVAFHRRPFNRKYARRCYDHLKHLTWRVFPQ